MSTLQSIKERLFNGIIKENPTFVMMLGMCPTLAVTTSCENGIGMGLTTTVVLAMSNLIISMLRKIIPDKVRVPAYIVIVASFVTIVQFLLEAYLPELNSSLGIYIPLIVVNCIILGRAEAYASKNPMIPSLFDGIGMGLGFTFGLGVLGAFREFLGFGTILSYDVLSKINKLIDMITESPELDFVPITIIGLAPGAFFVLAFLVAIQNKIRMSLQQKTKNNKKAISADDVDDESGDSDEENNKNTEKANEVKSCNGVCTACKGGAC